MRTAYRVKGVPEWLHRNPGTISIIAAGATDERVRRTREQFDRGRVKFDPKTQPRDATGKFRKILARLKTNLGGKELQKIVAEIRTAEKAVEAGDYAKTTESSRNVIKLVDDIESGTIDRAVEVNLREGAADLGRVLAYLPLPQGDNSAKVRFSDLPPSTGRLIQQMIDRVEQEVNSEDAKKIVKVLKSFISGVRSMSADEIGAELNKLMRFLV